MCIEISGDTLVRFEGQDEYYAVPDGVRRLADNAFYDRGRLIELTLPDSVTEIGDYAFKICSNMVRLRLPVHVDRLGIGVFQQCRKLERVDLPDGVQEIDAGMFVCCDFLSVLTIPPTVEAIDPIAFATCRSLREIHIAPERIGLLPERQRVLAAITYMREADPASEAGMEDAQADGRTVIHAFLSDRAEQIGRILIDTNDKKALNYMIRQGLIGSAAASALLERANKAHRTELTAMLLSRRRGGEELFEADPFA